MRALVLAFLALALCAPAPAASAADPLTQTIQARYEKLQAFSAGFTQTLSHKESGSVEQRQGTLLFQKPLRIRWQTARPHEETLVVTDREIWDYLPDEDVAYRYLPSLVQDSRSIIQVITGQAALTKDFEIKNEGQDDGLVRLRLYPKDPSPQMVEAVIWVERNTGYIRRAAITDFYGNGNDVRLTSFTPDARLEAGAFSFTPPKGIEVEDRIDHKVPERELFK